MLTGMYGACVYLCVQLRDGTWRSSLVVARAKVAPLKKLSLPRMELMGALLSARLVVFAREVLELPADISYSCWTDSTVTLAWVQSDPHRWKPFVANRVAEIQRLTNPARWHHCSGQVNPADLVTRGITAGELMHSDWLHGPEFLREGHHEGSSGVENVPGCAAVCIGREETYGCGHGDLDKIVPEEVAVCANVTSAVDDHFDIHRWGGYTEAPTEAVPLCW